MNQQRRSFRGRGGPTDRRLPKHNARRRQKHQSNSNHDENENENDHENENNENNVISRSFSNEPPTILSAEGKHSDDHFYHKEHKHKNKGKDRSDGPILHRMKDKADRTALDKGECVVVVSNCYSAIGSDNNDGPSKCSSSSAGDDIMSNNENNEDPPPPYLVEINHVKRRIRNVQEISIQTGRDAISSDLTNYQDNVLNATQNCLNQWRSISRHYNNNDGDDDDDDDDGSGLSSELRTEMGLAGFK